MEIQQDTEKYGGMVRRVDTDRDREIEKIPFFIVSCLQTNVIPPYCFISLCFFLPHTNSCVHLTVTPSPMKGKGKGRPSAAKALEKSSPKEEEEPESPPEDEEEDEVEKKSSPPPSAKKKKNTPDDEEDEEEEDGSEEDAPSGED